MNRFSLITGVGHGTTPLTSFDNALLSSGVANFNLVKISSILPPCLHLSNMVDLPEGSILYTAYAHRNTYEKDCIVSAAIAVGIPEDPNKIGVIMEFSGDCSAIESKKRASDMVVEAMDNREIEIKEILCEVAEGIGNGIDYITAFAALSIW